MPPHADTSTQAVEFTLDAVPVLARPGETLLEAARRSGVEIPSLCDARGLRPDGNCRACVVEIEGERALAASCCRRPLPGMRVTSASERVRASRTMVVELLLADTRAVGAHAGDELRMWAARLGADGSRFEARPALPADFSHPAIAFDPNACIACGRCVRACRESQGNDVIGWAGRGDALRVAFDQDDALGASSCVACGECVQACPTGALLAREPGGPRRADGARDDASRERRARRTEPAAERVAEPAAEQVAEPAAAPAAERVAERADEPAAERVAEPAAAPARSVDSLCPFCGVGCQMTYHVENERIVRVDGRDGPANRSRLCVKGRFGFDYAASPERLTVPLVRRPGVPKALPDGRVGEGWRDAFREASWDEAIALAAGGLARLRDGHGARSLAGFGSAKGSNEEAYLFQKLVRVGFGSNNVDHCTRLCHASSVAALLEGLGSGAVSNPVRDVLDAEVVFVIGANPAANHPVAATWIRNAVRAGTRLIVADPRRTELARLATHALQFRPDTDVALLNAMIHTLFDEDLVDREFVARRTRDWEAVRENVRAYSPEAMAPVCGIEASEIRAAARLFARSRASMILWGMGVSQHVHGTDNVRCLIALSLLAGQIGRPGTGLHPLRGQNNVQGASDAGLIPMMLPDYRRVDDPVAAARVERLWGTAIDRTPGLTVVEIMDAALAGRVRGMYIVGENPAMSDPDLAHARQALASLEWLVVQDIFPTETAVLADVILPASAFVEKAGTFTNTDRLVQLARPVLSPPGQARQDLWIIGAMARGLGLEWHYEHPREVWSEMRAAMDSIAGIPWERLERDGAVTYPCAGDDDPGQPVVFTERFPTPDGLARLVPAQPGPAAELPDAEWPLVLITGRQLEHWHTGAMTRRAALLDAIEPHPLAFVHPGELARHGVADGQRVRVASRRGAIELEARADDAMPPGAVFVAFAFAEAAANLLTQPALDPFGKIPEFKYCAVRLDAAGAEAAPR